MNRDFFSPWAGNKKKAVNLTPLGGVRFTARNNFPQAPFPLKSSGKGAWGLRSEPVAWVLPQAKLIS